VTALFADSRVEVSHRGCGRRAQAVAGRGDNVLTLQRAAGNRATTALLQRLEQGSGLDDPLYLADRRWSAGQGPDDRMTGRRLQNWAIAVGSAVIRLDYAIKRMQVQETGAEDHIVGEIYSLLIDLLRGDQMLDTQQTVVGDDRYPYDEIDEVRRKLGNLVRFEGSANARERAVMELSDHWGPIARYLMGALDRVYQQAAFDALARTPRGMELVTDIGEIKRLRAGKLHNHEHVIAQAGFSDAILRPGQRYGRVHVVDVYKWLGTRTTGPGTVWGYVDGYPLWYYQSSVDLFDRQAFIGEAARSAYEQSKFAAALFPAMIKLAGFALSFSPMPAMMIAGVLLDELGEEGLREINLEPGRSGGEIAKDSLKEIAINLVFHKLFGGGGEGSAAEAGEKLTRAVEKAAAQARGAVEKEIIRTEGPQLVSKLEAGEVRRVEDAALRNDGFTEEVTIKHDGGTHTYRHRTDGTWCRWSTLRFCQDMGEEVARAARTLEAGKAGQITSDLDRSSLKTFKKGGAKAKTVYEVKKASAVASEQAEARMGEVFQRDGYDVHFNADDRHGDLTIKPAGAGEDVGRRADVKLLTQTRSINSPVLQAVGQAPDVIIDGTVVRLTRADTERMVADLEQRIAQHPERYKGIETIYIVEGSAEHPTIYIHHRTGAPLRVPDPTHPTLRGAAGE
jgi:predicted NUDIX family NTP pyrophosphohydrolase